MTLLIKAGAKDHMEALYNNGELYFNTIKYFRELEEKEDGRGDKNEYLDALYVGRNALKDAKVQFNFFNPSTQNIETINSSFETGLRGFSIMDKNPSPSHIYCMSLVKTNVAKDEKPLIPIENFAENKDYAVIVYDLKAFMDRIQQCLIEKNLPMKSGIVEYIDNSDYAGDMGCFKKFKKFSYQNEWRLATTVNSLEPQKLYIGSLEGIAAPPMYKDEFLKIRAILQETSHR